LFPLFATGVLVPVVHLDVRISPQIVEEIQNDPNVIFRGVGKMIHKKPEAKFFGGTVPLRVK
jgi:hypothetical protein